MATTFVVHLCHHLLSVNGRKITQCTIRIFPQNLIWAVAHGHERRNATTILQPKRNIYCGVLRIHKPLQPMSKDGSSTHYTIGNICAYTVAYYTSTSVIVAFPTTYQYVYGDHKIPKTLIFVFWDTRCLATTRLTLQ